MASEWETVMVTPEGTLVEGRPTEDGYERREREIGVEEATALHVRAWANGERERDKQLDELVSAGKPVPSPNPADLERVVRHTLEGNRLTDKQKKERGIKA